MTKQLNYWINMEVWEKQLIFINLNNGIHFLFCSIINSCFMGIYYLFFKKMEAHQVFLYCKYSFSSSIFLFDFLLYFSLFQNGSLWIKKHFFIPIFNNYSNNIRFYFFSIL
jgi:hypothetical protein